MKLQCIKFLIIHHPPGWMWNQFHITFISYSFQGACVLMILCYKITHLMNAVDLLDVHIYTTVKNQFTRMNVSFLFIKHMILDSPYNEVKHSITCHWRHTNANPVLVILKFALFLCHPFNSVLRRHKYYQ